MKLPDIQRFRDGFGHAGRAEIVERQMPCIAQPCFRRTGGI